MKHHPDISVLANASRELLNQGDPIGAERVLSPVFNDLKSDPAVLHLMGLIKKAQSKWEEAERYLRAAVANTLTDGGYYNDLGVVLQQRGAYADAERVFRAALALMPGAAQVHINLVRCLMADGKLDDAERETRGFIAMNPGPEGWTLLGQVQRAQERNAEALDSAERALKYAPRLRGLRQTYATALDRVGRTTEALPIYEQLAQENLDSPELALNFARALYAEGRKEDGERVLEQAIGVWNNAVTLHGPLARMRWLRGEGEDCTTYLEAEIAKRPQDLALRLSAADALHRGRHLEKALRTLFDAIQVAPDNLALLTAYGILLDEVERTEDGLKVLRRVEQVTPNRSTRRNLISTLLRSGRADEALTIIRALREEDQDEQYLIACEATAMRLTGDESYKQVFDYARLVKTYEIAPPRGFFTTQNFNASLADVLRMQHRTNAHPLDQFLHEGSQTSRSLLTVDEPNLKAFLKACDSGVRDYISALTPALDDPIGRRRSDRFRFSGLWSVRLRDGGYQPNHVHDRGWISSAYYVSVLPAERPKDPNAGKLKFGEPHRPMRGCTPEHMVEPQTGTLVLFPSYMWHGTVPFEGQERLSMAFDVIPA